MEPLSGPKMKLTKILLSPLCSVCLIGPAFASDPAAYCSAVAAGAEQIMAIRQDNGDMEHVMKIVKGNKVDELMVQQAFERPRFLTANNKKQAIQDFRNEWYLSCTKTEGVD